VANHCVDVMCLKCGAGWCERGCGAEHGPSKEYLANKIKYATEWSKEFKDGDPESRYVDCKDLKCPHCKDGGRIIID
jgi:hypothetical protein